MKKKTTYKISYSIPGEDYYEFIQTSSIKKARRIIERLYSNALACWKTTVTSRKHETEKIFRNIRLLSDYDYWNNTIKANVKNPISSTLKLIQVKELERRIKKMEMNSYLPLYANNHFIMYDPDLIEAITEEGSKIIHDLGTRTRDTDPIT